MSTAEHLYLPVINTLTFLVSLWIAVAMYRHMTDDKMHEIPLRTRLRHPTMPCEELAKTDE